MLALFNRSYCFGVAIVILCAFNTLDANVCCSSCNSLYIGAFGGELFSNSPEMRQTGTAFFASVAGGPLAVDARGDTSKTSPGFGGVQLGYAWSECPFTFAALDWAVISAIEAEAFFYREIRRGELINIAQDRLDEHDFLDSFSMFAGVYVINGVFILNSPCTGRYAPYLGIGIGAAHLSARKAVSLQISPLELGINHFNSDRNDTAWTFVMQAKGGIQYALCDSFRFFVEYRFLLLDPSQFTFGSTVYPNHVPTSTWDVDLGQITYHGFAFGVQIDL